MSTEAFHRVQLAMDHKRIHNTLKRMRQLTALTQK